MDLIDFFTILISMTCILRIYRLYKGLLCGKFSQMHKVRSTTRDGRSQNNNKGVSFWIYKRVVILFSSRVLLWDHFKRIFSSQSWARVFLIRVRKIYIPYMVIWGVIPIKILKILITPPILDGFDWFFHHFDQHDVYFTYI